MKFISIVIISLLASFTFINAQTVSGVIRDYDDDHLVSGVIISLENSEVEVKSGNDGKFSLETNGVLDGTLMLKKSGFDDVKKSFIITANQGNIGTIIIKSSLSDAINNINDFDDIDTDDDGDNNTYSLLTAGRDLFSNTAAFGFGAARFKVRGYDNNKTSISLNGATMNNLNDGNIYWSVWGGLNDVFRERININNVSAGDFGFGRVGGASDLDLRASSQRKQIRGSYSISNRTYTNRLMLTYSTGMMNNGWAFTASGSKRWANEGYVEGTFYDAYSYFLSVDKKLSKSHMLNLVVLGAPVKRGKGGASTQEAYDIAGSNFYNPNWGFQNGEKRNSRVVDAHQPVAILRHDWTINERLNISTSAAVQMGTYGTSRLEWNDAPDPRPDYYKNLPSYQLTDESEAQVYDYLEANPEKMQLDWDKFYNSNFHTDPVTINDVGGVTGSSVTGKNAVYALAETHYDNQKLSLQSHFNYEISSRSILNGGVFYRKETVNNYQKLIDLLGADFYLDIDKFAQRDNIGDVDFYQSDLNNPNRPAVVGDVIRYNYDIVTSVPGAWAQYELKLNKFDFYIGGEANSTSFYRDGLMRNGKFPENSFGESEKINKFGYGAKAGATYKLNGRNYFTLNSAYTSTPIGARYAFASPRTRNNLINKLDNELSKSIDVSYVGRFTGFKVKATAYFTRFENQNYNRSLYLDDASNSSFVNYIMTGIDKEHKGLELAAEKELGAGFSLKAVAALGDYRYKSRPNINITFDNSGEADESLWVGYLNNYVVPNTPQIAYNATLTYNSSNYWWANLSFNYFDKMYVDIFPHRRTSEFVTGVDKELEPEKWYGIISQEQVPANYTMDMFVGKSWKIRDHFLYLNVGVNNILNNTTFKTGGYEQSRFDTENQDPNKFPPRYFYAYGTNYFISIAVKL